MPQVAHPIPQNIKKPLKTNGFLMFFEMQPMQQVTKKCSQNLPKGSKNRAQDAAKMASWSPPGRQEASQTTPQHKKTIAFYSFFASLLDQMLPRAPQDIPLRANIAQNSSQDASSSPSNPPKHQKTFKNLRFFNVF